MRIVDKDYAAYVAASDIRVKAARGIADKLRHDDTLHRLAMRAVFVLEDVHEALIELQNRTKDKPK